MLSQVEPIPCERLRVTTGRHLRRQTNFAHLLACCTHEAKSIRLLHSFTLYKHVRDIHPSAVCRHLASLVHVWLPPPLVPTRCRVYSMFISGRFLEKFSRSPRLSNSHYAKMEQILRHAKKISNHWTRHSYIISINAYTLPSINLSVM